MSKVKIGPQVRLHCLACALRWLAFRFRYTCPNCGRSRVEVSKNPYQDYMTILYV